MTIFCFFLKYLMTNKFNSGLKYLPYAQCLTPCCCSLHWWSILVLPCSLHPCSPNSHHLNSVAKKNRRKFWISSMPLQEFLFGLQIDSGKLPPLQFNPVSWLFAIWTMSIFVGDVYLNPHPNACSSGWRSLEQSSIDLKKVRSLVLVWFCDRL